MIIERYLVREIVRPLATIFAVLVALFASYSAAAFLSDAAHGLLAARDIAALTGLKVLIALEVLIPAALFVSVILSYTRMYAESEFAAMASLRVSPLAATRAAAMVAACLAIAVGTLSLVVRPWAYRSLHELSGRAASLMDVDDMLPGTFYVGQQGNRVVLLAHRAGRGQPAQNIFVLLRRSDLTEIISAQLGYAVPPAATTDAVSNVYLRNAYVYDIDRKDKQADSVLEANGIVLNPNGAAAEAPGYSSVAASSRTIAGSASSEDIAELQWRLSTPLSTFLLGMLAVPLSQVKPRGGRYARLTTALLLYFGYYLLSTSARTWVQHGAVDSFPGIWWVSALLVLVLVATLPRPDLRSWLHKSA